MMGFPAKLAKVLLLSIVGLAAPLSSGSAQDKPVVLLIVRSENPYAGQASLKVAIDKEAGTIIGKLNALGYGVDVASEDGKDIHAGGSTLRVDKKLADVEVTHYAGAIIPCMTTSDFPSSAVKIVKDMHSRHVPVGAQNGGVIILDRAGVLKGRNYSIGEDSRPYVRDGVFLKVDAVVQDGDIVTSGVCPYYAQVTGLKDGTDELVTTFAAMLKK
jgi:hypothetical protein